jgi:cephalosporin hydroxylase
MMNNYNLTPEEQKIADDYHNLFYNKRIGPHNHRIWEQTFWRGFPVLKHPADLWNYQEIVFETQPDLIIETGTYASGTSLFLAHLLDLNGKGKVVTIDIKPLSVRAVHPRITYLTGSSIDPQLVQSIFTHHQPEERVLVILDSNHTRDHVIKEIELYAPQVSIGSYLIVEDSNINGHPVYPSFGPGPHEALQEFLSYETGFIVDKSREKFLVTWNPSGYLKRIR